jgi:hypothetical protein
MIRTVENDKQDAQIDYTDARVEIKCTIWSYRHRDDLIFKMVGVITSNLDALYREILGKDQYDSLLVGLAKGEKRDRLRSCHEAVQL